MDSIIQVIRHIVRDELRSLHIGEVGTVTSVFPIADPAGIDNYACSVLLRDRDIELPKVPIATPNVGMVSCPQVDDLVLITFIGGDGNDPVVIGRLHSEKVRPPAHEDGELVIESPLGGDTRLSFSPAGQVVISAGDAELSLDPEEGNIAVTGAALTITASGDVTLEGEGGLELAVQGDATIKVDGDTTVETSNCTVNASGDILLGEGGSPVITENSHKCYFTGAPLIGSATVKAKD
ncbi:MAG: phage baseplate assembly protein V [Myxococcota bacterium]